MNVFYTRAVAHLAQTIKLPRAEYEVKQFSDGELYIKIDPDTITTPIWIVATTMPPAENALELFFLLDVLKRAGARHINIFFAYVGYARQALALAGEASSAECLGRMLDIFSLNKHIGLHVHAHQLIYKTMGITSVVDMQFFIECARGYNIIAAPDKGVAWLAQEIAKQTNKQLLLLTKTRSAHEKVYIENINEHLSGARILLVDDMITTAHTLAHASLKIKNAGAASIAAAATHGIFSPGAHQRLQNSSIDQVYVTNSIKQKNYEYVHVHDVGPFIQYTIQKAL